MRAAKALASLRTCADPSEHSLLGNAISTKSSCSGSNYEECKETISLLKKEYIAYKSKWHLNICAVILKWILPVDALD